MRRPPRRIELRDGTVIERHDCAPIKVRGLLFDLYSPRDEDDDRLFERCRETGDLWETTPVRRS